MWGDLSLTTKGFAVILLPTIALLAGFALLYRSLLAEDDAAMLVKRAVEVRTNIQMLISDVSEAEAAARGFVLSPLPDFQERFRKVEQEVPGRLERLEALVADDPGQMKRAADLRRLIDERLKGLRALMGTAGSARTESEVLVTRGHAIMQDLRSLVQSLDSEEARGQTARVNAAENARTVTLARAQAMVGFGLAGGLIAMALFSRSIVRRVQLIQQNARCLRMEQALVPLRLGEDEIGQVEKELEVTSELLASRGKKLRESEERLQAIIDQTTAVIYVKDLEGRYILINRHYEELFSVTREEARGRTDSEVFPKQIAAKFRENDLRVMSAGRPLEFEEIAPHRDGLHTYISLKFPLLDASKRPYAVCGISTDITERKRFEDALRHANEELARQSEGLSALASPPVDFSAPPVGWIAESRREVTEEALN